MDCDVGSPFEDRYLDFFNEDSFTSHVLDLSCPIFVAFGRDQQKLNFNPLRFQARSDSFGLPTS